MAILAVLVCLVAQASSPYLQVGEKVLVPAPPAYLAGLAVACRWSADSSQFVYQAGDIGTSRSMIRAGLAKLGRYEVETSQLCRYDVASGRNEVLVGLRSDAYLGNIDLVGPGGDAIFELRRVENDGKQFAQIWFAPVGKKTAAITEWIESSSSSVIASRKKRRAIVALAGPSGLTVAGISDSGFQKIQVDSDWKYGVFSGNTVGGTAVLVVSKPGADGRFFSINYDSFTVSDITDGRPEYELRVEKKLPLKLDRVELPKSEIAMKEDTLYDIVLSNPDEPARRLLFARGVTNGSEISPDGLKLVYSTPHGAFLRELVPVSAATAKRLTAGN